MDPFIGEIRIFAGNYAPYGWAECNGQLLSIQQNTALYSLLGTMYGGDGRTNFALPNLRGLAPLQQGQGTGLSLYHQGQSGGASSVQLLQSQIPAHAHQIKASTEGGTQTDPKDMVWAVAGVTKGVSMYTSTLQAAQMNPLGFATTGDGQAHNNLMPYLPLTFIIALQGIYPTRE